MIATSCETVSEVDVTTATDGLATVTFNVNAPEMSRAFSDGLTANQLQYAVYTVKYDAAGALQLEELKDLTVALSNGDDQVKFLPIQISRNVEIQLATGNEYAIIFWAAAENSPYTVDFANRTMTVDYNGATANDENRDAFYCYQTFKVEGTMSVDAILKRPFAQVNIGANDYSAAKSAGYVVTKSQVEVPVYTQLDFVTGETIGEMETVTFSYSNVPTTEVFPVAGYEYVAMNYLLMNAFEETINVKFFYSDENNNAKERKVGSVPVKRNHRTNIFGQLFTSKVNFNVIIKPEYDDPDYNYPSTSHQELLLAATAGGNVTLTEDVVLVEPLNITASLNVNLNGKTISLNVDRYVQIDENGNEVVDTNGNKVYVKPAVLSVAEGATLVISNGTVSSLGKNAGSAILNEGTVTATDVTLNGAPQDGNAWPSYTVNNGGTMTLNNVAITSVHGGVASYGTGAVATLNNCSLAMTGIAGMTSHGFYTTDNGEIYINGGTYANNAADQNSTGGSVLGGTVIVSNGAFAGRVATIYGTPVLKGGNYTVEPAASYIAAGYKAVEVAGKYYVVPVDVTGVTAVIENNLGMDVDISDETTASAQAFKAHSAAFATAVATDNGAKTLFDWEGISYVAEFEKATIYASPANTESMRYIVEGSAVKEATVAEGITVVGDRTFRKCTALTTVNLPTTLVEVGPAAFQQCAALTNIVLPASVKTIGEQAFYGCTALASINIPEGVTRIEKFGLRATGLTSVELPASVTYIGEFAFRDCDALTEIVINAPSFTCEKNAFYNVAAPYPTTTIKVANKPMKAYLESLFANDSSLRHITVVEM